MTENEAVFSERKIIHRSILSRVEINLVEIGDEFQQVSGQMICVVQAATCILSFVPYYVPFMS